jgi:hypothetical protein
MPTAEFGALAVEMALHQLDTAADVVVETEARLLTLPLTVRESTAVAPVPPRVEYEITDLGLSLAPLFAALAEWTPNLDRVEQARKTYDLEQRKPTRRSGSG